MYFFLIKKYLRIDRDQPFITISAILAFFGIAIGVMVLIIAMSVMNGLDKDFKKRLLVMNTPIDIHQKRGSSITTTTLNDLKNRYRDMKFSGYIYTNSVAIIGTIVKPGLMYGVNISDEKSINSILNRDFKRDYIDKFEIIIGNSLYKEIDLYSNISEKLKYTFFNSSPSGFGSSLIVKRFNIIGKYSSGFANYDNAISYVNIESLRKVLHLPNHYYSGIHVFSNNPKTDIIKLKKYLKDRYKIVGWWEKNGNIFYALKLEKRAMMAILMLIILVAGINIISSTLMTIMNRRKEIALMLSLGMRQNDIKNIFLYLGITIGIAGILLGITLGFTGIWILGNFDIISLPKDVYGSTRVPISFELLDLVYIITGTLIITFLSSYYPSSRASKIDALKVLRED